MKNILLGTVLLIFMLGCTSGGSAPVLPLRAGSYEVSAKGMNGDFPVTVTLSESAIISVAVGENAETLAMGEYAIAVIPGRIVEKQSVAVDVVSGATVTSRAIMAAVEAALVQAGAGIQAFNRPAARRSLARGSTETWDVVIVGAGLSGVMAAYDFAERNPSAKVLLLEKQDIIMGSLPIAGGVLAGTTSSLHRKHNAESSVDDIISIMEFTSKDPAWVDRDLVRNVYGLSDELYTRLLNWNLNFLDRPIQSVKYVPQVYGFIGGNELGSASIAGITYGGSGFARFFNRLVAENPIPLRTGSKVVDLVVSGGRVTGVKVQDHEKEYQINAKAVLLATGGFANNPELMQKYNANYVGTVMRSYQNATGDGFKLVERFGTPVLGKGVMGFQRADMRTATIASMFIVDINGNRFTDETAPGYEIARAMGELGRDFYAIVDGKFQDKQMIQDRIARGFIKEYQTLEALAQGCGINQAQFLATVRAYNSAVDQKRSPGFDLPAGSAVRLDTPPYYAEKSLITYFGTIPGIDIDSGMHVMDGRGNIVSGLYAAGELTFGNIVTNRYPGVGLGISYATYSGPAATRSILADLGF
jgi:fumarate reductase flavoprotein subunit